MRGRPKGTTKEDSKKLKTFRLSKFENEVVQNVLKLLRGKIEEFEPNEYRFLTDNIYFEAKSSVIFDEDENRIDNSNLKVLYAVNTSGRDDIFISKCPIISSTQRTYTIKNINKENNVTSTKINKDSIDNKSIYFKNYHLALAHLLECKQSLVLNSILEMNNSTINNQFLKVLKTHGLYPALEYGIELLNMSYLFEVKDYTTKV